MSKAKDEWEEAGFESEEAYEKYEADSWNEASKQMREDEGRWIDNGCSNSYNDDEEYYSRPAF